MGDDFSPWEQVIDEYNDLFVRAFSISKWKIKYLVRILLFGNTMDEWVKALSHL